MTTEALRRRMTWIPWAALAAFLFVTQVGINRSLKWMEAGVPGEPDQTTQKWNPDLFRALTFGHWTTAVDWLWMKSIQDQSISHVAKGAHASAYYDLDLATDLDPAFFEVYVSGANLLAVIRDDTVGARDLLLKGEKFRLEELPKESPEFRQEYWGMAWQVPVLLAYCYLFEFNDMPSAAKAFSDAAAIPGAPAYLQRLDQRLKQPGGQYAVGLKLLNFMISGAKDPEILKELSDKRDSLIVAEYLDRVRQAFAKFRGAHPGPDAQVAWAKFLKAGGAPELDPWGGRLSVDHSGKVETSTPHEPVFGLD